jgi:hypothetical protein
MLNTRVRLDTDHKRGEYDPDRLPPVGLTKLVGLQPNGLPRFTPPASEWIGGEQEQQDWWFSKTGGADVTAIKLRHSDGSVTEHQRGRG